MDDKDRIGESRGSEDALRPLLPGGERARSGESGDDETKSSIQSPVVAPDATERDAPATAKRRKD